MRHHYKWRTVKCPVCDKAFEASRPDATFCSSTCRTKARRASQAKDKAIAKAKTAIEELLKYETSASVADCLKEVFDWLINPNPGKELAYTIREFNPQIEP